MIKLGNALKRKEKLISSGDWPDPVTGLTPNQLKAKEVRKKAPSAPTPKYLQRFYWREKQRQYRAKRTTNSVQA